MVIKSMKIKCDKSKFKLEILILILITMSTLAHIYRIIFKYDKISTEIILTLVFFIIVFISIIILLNNIYIKVTKNKIYISVLDILNKRILKDNININDIEKYGFSKDLKLDINKYDIAILAKNKRLVIPVNQFKNKDILKLLDLIEEKTNIKPSGFAKNLRKTDK